MQKEKPRILAQLNHYRENRPVPFWTLLTAAGMSMFGMMAAFGTAPGTLEQRITQETVVESLSLSNIAPVAAAETLPYVREERIQRGDSVISLLQRMGVDDPAAQQFLLNDKKAQTIARQLSPGKQVSARIGTHGELLGLTFPLNGGKDQALFIERETEGFDATEKALPLETQVHIKSAVIRYSLFGATDAADIPDSVATQMADIFGGDIDFHRDLRKGDRFTVIYETLIHQGKPVRTGRILAAEFVNDGKAYRAFWFGQGQEGGYYTADGKNIRKAFLRSPLEFSRVTSGFSGARFHPVLQTWRAHKGVDYGAPTGTRIRSTADGIVEFAGKQGGYGNVVILRHQSRYTTLYGHMSGFAPGIRKGTRVSQGETIGFVGATGLASGPHLHYEFRINEVHQNPLTAVMPSAPPLAAQQLPDFKRHTESYLTQIEMTRGGNLALLN